MAYQNTDVRIGTQPLDYSSATQQLPLGSRVMGSDPTLGQGEFIYLKGVASTAVGDAVTWDENFATARTLAASRGPIGIAMSANVANQFGWYQIAGMAVCKVAAAFAADAAVCVIATAGTVDDANTANQNIDGARSQSAIDTPLTGFAYISLQYPAANGATAG